MILYLNLDTWSFSCKITVFEAKTSTWHVGTEIYSYLNHYHYFFVIQFAPYFIMYMNYYNKYIFFENSDRIWVIALKMLMAW